MRVHDYTTGGSVRYAADFVPSDAELPVTATGDVDVDRVPYETVYAMTLSRAHRIARTKDIHGEAYRVRREKRDARGRWDVDESYYYDGALGRLVRA